MADFDDLQVSSEDWVNVHSSLSISTGTKITLQNAGLVLLRAVNAVAKPSATKTQGIRLLPDSDDEFESIPEITEVTWVIASSDVGYVSVRT